MDNGGENIEILELSMIHHLGFENETIKFVCTIFLAQQTIIWNTSLKKTNLPGMKILRADAAGDQGCYFPGLFDGSSPFIRLDVPYLIWWGIWNPLTY